MSIKSDAFGRVELTGRDAKKFHDQVKYGRPKKEARVATAQGVGMARELQQSGTIRLKLRELA